MSSWMWFVALYSRVTLNLAVRVTYPFLPAIARGLGISFEKAGLLVAARHLVGLTGALWGLLAERKGYAWGMLLGLSALFIGSLTASVSRTFSLALLGFVLIGSSKPVYDPNVQAFASGRIPYSKRAWALGTACGSLRSYGFFAARSSRGGHLAAARCGTKSAQRIAQKKAESMVTLPL